MATKIHNQATIANNKNNKVGKNIAANNPSITPITYKVRRIGFVMPHNSDHSHAPINTKNPTKTEKNEAGIKIIAASKSGNAITAVITLVFITHTHITSAQPTAHPSIQNAFHAFEKSQSLQKMRCHQSLANTHR